MTEQLSRLICIPIATCLFLYAAQMSAGLIERDGFKVQVALK